MTLERSDPIPVGTYWIDAFDLRPEGNIIKFESWLKANRSTVRVLDVRKRFPSSGIDINRRTHYWFLFEIKSPTKRWPLSVKIGVPTVAKKGKETTIQDTAKKPEVWSPVKAFTSFKAGFVGGGSLALLAVLFVLSKKK